MGRLALQEPASRARVADWKKQPGMLGMRFTFHNEHYRPFLTDGTADWLPAAERGIPLMVLMPGVLTISTHRQRASWAEAGDRSRQARCARQGPRVFEAAGRLCPGRGIPTWQ